MWITTKIVKFEFKINDGIYRFLIVLKNLSYTKSRINIILWSGKLTK